jgi:hypothetical protein
MDTLCSERYTVGLVTCDVESTVKWQSGLPVKWGATVPAAGQRQQVVMLCAELHTNGQAAVTNSYWKCIDRLAVDSRHAEQSELSVRWLAVSSKQA